jgi:hypothetical protein
LTIFFLNCIFLYGQVARPTLTPTPIPASTQTLSQRMESQMEISSKRNSLAKREIALRKIEVLYRKSTNAELKILSVDLTLVEQYKGLLKNRRTGLIRLMPDLGCSKNDKLIVSSDYCTKYSMPGSGSTYSFRVTDYRIQRLGDLVLRDNHIYADGMFIQAAMANLGDKAIESLTLESEGIKELVAFKPDNEIGLVAKQVARLKKGFLVSNTFFANNLDVEKNSTYILRSIAFNTKHFVASHNITYNEFDYDKRRDIMIVFRIIEKNADGSIVLLWKELRNEKAPKLKLRTN